MKLFLVASLVVCCCIGCGAGTTADLLTYDNIIAATVEAKKGVEAYNTAVIADAVYRRENLLKAIGTGIEALALQDEKITPEEAKKMATTVVESLRGHLANQVEQERRRAELYSVTIDNLNYVIQISEQGKKFTLYRASISAQWKAYLESSAKNYIGSLSQ